MNWRRLVYIMKTRLGFSMHEIEALTVSQVRIFIDEYNSEEEAERRANERITSGRKK